MDTTCTLRSTGVLKIAQKVLEVLFGEVEIIEFNINFLSIEGKALKVCSTGDGSFVKSEFKFRTDVNAALIPPHSDRTDPKEHLRMYLEIWDPQRTLYTAWGSLGSAEIGLVKTHDGPNAWFKGTSANCRWTEPIWGWMGDGLEYSI
ncbi:MAG: hypothetical protein V4481_04770 [Patescibacteria group bacterium]